MRTISLLMAATRFGRWCSSRQIEIDFTSSKVTYRGEEFGFPALGSVPQALVVAGGIENLVRQKLAGS